jgi:hypothetical protein
LRQQKLQPPLHGLHGPFASGQQHHPSPLALLLLLLLLLPLLMLPPLWWLGVGGRDR